MSNYKRLYLPGHSYFFTVVTADRQPFFAEQENIQLLKAAFHYVRARKPYQTDAICILSDHLHCIWTLPHDCDYSIRWQMLKTHFTRRFRHQAPEQKHKNIWQPRYWEHAIRDRKDFDKHVDYIHYNPVKHVLVECVNEWRFSSFKKFYEQGFYEESWGSVESDAIAGMNCE